MAVTSKLGKVSIATSNRPRARFNLSHDVNTTASFGETQPLLCRLLAPGTKSSLNIESLVRLAPMVAPSFGRVKWETWSKFVPISDLSKNFAAMMAQTTVARGMAVFTPQESPCIAVNLLSLYVLIGAEASIYKKTAGGTYSLYKTTLEDPTADGFVNSSGQAFYDDLVNANIVIPRSETYNWLGGYQHPGVSLNSGFLTGYGSWSFHIPINRFGSTDLFDDSAVSGERSSIVNLDSADYVVERKIQSSNVDFAIAFRLSDFGRRLRKIFLGCGYQINFDLADTVSLFPLLAYYKAYWDIFGLTLYDNYESTNCSRLSTFIDYNNIGNVDDYILDGSGPFYLLSSFMYDLSNCWVTDAQDFVSANMQSTAVSPAFGTSGFVDVNPVEVTSGKGGNVKQGVNIAQQPITDASDSHTYGQPWINNVIHTQLDSEVLKKLYKWTNRNTIAGRRIAELLRAQGLGKYVDDCKSDFIGHTETQVSISDVVSTSDTFDTNTDSGALLGEYGGRGLKYDHTKNFVFENDEFGYWITIAAIVPQGGYCQAIDANNFCIDKESFYNPEFDGVGMEATKFSQILGSLDWSRSNSLTSLPRTFGFAPRYSGLKVKMNVMNGDFNQRSTRNSYLPYTLDKIIDVGDSEVAWSSSNENETIYAVRPVVSADVIPTAGNAWRYNSRYYWLNNFDRIFANIGERPNILPQDSTILKQDYYEISWRSYDKFLIHNCLDLVAWSPMLPIEDSYETKSDGNDGYDDLSISKA